MAKFKILTEGDIVSVCSTKGIAFSRYKNNNKYCPMYSEVAPESTQKYFTNPLDHVITVQKPSGYGTYKSNELIWDTEFANNLKKRTVEYVETITPGGQANAIAGSESCGAVSVVKKIYWDGVYNSQQTVVNNQSVCYTWPTDNPGPNERTTTKDYTYTKEDGTTKTVQVTVKQKGSATIIWDWGTGNGWSNGTTTKLITQYVAPGRPLTAPANGVKNTVTNATGTYTYTFNGWNPTKPATCSGNATFTALYTENYTPATYTITWSLDTATYPNAKWTNGTTANKTNSCNYGSNPTAPETPPDFIVDTATQTIVYTFNGWSPTITTCTGNTTYKATFKVKSTTNKEGVQNWDPNGGSWDLNYTQEWDPNGGDIEQSSEDTPTTPSNISKLYGPTEVNYYLDADCSPIKIETVYDFNNDSAIHQLILSGSVVPVQNPTTILLNSLNISLLHLGAYLVPKPDNIPEGVEFRLPIGFEPNISTVTNVKLTNPHASDYKVVLESDYTILVAKLSESRTGSNRLILEGIIFYNYVDSSGLTLSNTTKLNIYVLELSAGGTAGGTSTLHNTTIAFETQPGGKYELDTQSFPSSFTSAADGKLSEPKTLINDCEYTRYYSLFSYGDSISVPYEMTTPNGYERTISFPSVNPVGYDGKTFDGWYYKDGTEVINGDKVTCLTRKDSTDRTSFGGSFTVYAKYK